MKLRPVMTDSAARTRWKHSAEAEIAAEIAAETAERKRDKARAKRWPAEPPLPKPRYVNARVGTWVPYNPRLRSALAAALRCPVSVNSTILFTHMEWRFKNTKGHPFWKNQRASRLRKEDDAPGGSWRTETGLSPKEFRTAFRQLGVCYASKGAFDATPAAAQFTQNGVEKPYASYFDRLRKRTYFLRNEAWFDRFAGPWLA